MQSDEGVTAESVSEHLGGAVEGESVDVGEDGERIGERCDLGRVRKVYKLGGEGTGKKGKGGGSVNGVGSGKDEKKEVESVVLGIIALKGS